MKIIDLFLKNNLTIYTVNINFVFAAIEIASKSSSRHEMARM
jgi:hypothetical protein